VTPCSVVVGYQLFRDPCCFHLRWVVTLCSVVVGYQISEVPAASNFSMKWTSEMLVPYHKKYMPSQPSRPRLEKSFNFYRHSYVSRLNPGQPG
jgi:hypothetical protein